MKISLTIAAVIMSCAAQSQLFFANNTSEPVCVAIAQRHDEDKNFKYLGSIGWYTVEPGEKKEISTGIGNYDDIYYYAASAVSNKRYTGNTALAVDPKNPFFIKNCDMAYVLKENRALVVRKFRHVSMNTRLFQTKFTIDLND